jgi:hypothetical protein
MKHEETLQSIKRANIWIKILLIYFSVRHAQINIGHRVKAKVKWMKFLFTLNMMKFKFKRSLLKKRPTFNKR